MANNNRNAERLRAKKRAEAYRAARNAPGADKGKLKREYHQDKRNRKNDRHAEHGLRYGAWQRKFQQKKYDRDMAAGNMNPGDHSELLNGTGAFAPDRIAEYEKYKKNERKYKRTPGSLAAEFGYS